MAVTNIRDRKTKNSTLGSRQRHEDQKCENVELKRKM